MTLKTETTVRLRNRGALTVKGDRGRGMIVLVVEKQVPVEGEPGVVETETLTVSLAPSEADELVDALRLLT